MINNDERYFQPEDAVNLGPRPLVVYGYIDLPYNPEVDYSNDVTFTSEVLEKMVDKI